MNTISYIYPCFIIWLFFFLQILIVEDNLYINQIKEAVRIEIDILRIFTFQREKY
jgi:hypothetical protein